MSRGVPWSEYEEALAERGERSTPRIAYLKGDMEIVRPSLDHQATAKTISRLLEAYAEERGLVMNAYGSWTIKSAPKERGVEPDECYIFSTERRDAPDLAIDVVWTHGGLDKLDIYAGLGVREVWMWRDERIEVYGLRGDGYERVERSQFVPELDVELLVRFLDRDDQTRAVREFRAALRRADG